MMQQISGYHLDENNDWVAELSCGHYQHVRHKPPLVIRDWVLTEQGRRLHLGTELNCIVCDEEVRNES